MSGKIEKSVYDKRAGTSGVTDIVGTSIFFINAPQGTSFPFVTIQRVGTEPINHATGNGGTFNVTDQIDMYDKGSAGYEAVKNLADAVRDALSGWTDTTADPSVGMSLLVSERDDIERPEAGRGRPIYRVSQDYSIWFA